MEKNIYNQDLWDAYNSETGFDIVALKTIIENSYGEKNELDFKEDIIEESKITKTILAMTNNGGGSIIFGISDKGKAIGINKQNLKDPTDFERKVRSYLPENLIFRFQFITFREEDIYGELSNKTFIIIFSPKQYRFVPFLAKKQSEHLKTNVVYVRKNTSNEVATNEDLEKMFKLRLLDQYEDLSNMDLEEHINQLKVLYRSITQKYGNSIFEKVTTQIYSPIFKHYANPHYPEEGFDEFIAKIIVRKKSRIEILLDLDKVE